MTQRRSDTSFTPSLNHTPDYTDVLDTYLPSQVPSVRPWSPAQRLCLAILNDCVTVLATRVEPAAPTAPPRQRHIAARQARERDEAWRWVRGGFRATNLLGIEQVAAAVGLELTYLRRQLQRVAAHPEDRRPFRFRTVANSGGRPRPTRLRGWGPRRRD